jgi:hypothetical protein
MAKGTVYHSYLLRIWQTGDDESCTWRASLEQPGTRARRGFASLDELFRFLRDQAAAELEHSPEEVDDWSTTGGASGPVETAR